MSERQTCGACGASTPHAFCKRCWRLAPLWGRAELAWWLGEGRRAGRDEAALTYAYAAWSITADWLAALILAELQKRQAKRAARKSAPRRRARSLKKLADEADARA